MVPPISAIEGTVMDRNQSTNLTVSSMMSLLYFYAASKYGLLFFGVLN